MRLAMRLACSVYLLSALASCRSESPAPVASEPTRVARSTASTRHAGEPDTALPRGEVRFADRTADSGIEFTYRTGEEAGHAAILESLGGGAGVVDYDLDGRVDLFFPGGGYYSERQEVLGHPSALWRNLGDWRFTQVTESARLSVAPQYTHGCSVSDYDNDGFSDILVTGYGRLTLWHNQGDGTFQERHQEAKLDDTLWSSSAGWGDLNQDGNPDLYVAHYGNWSFDNHPYCVGPTPEQREICPPRSFDPLPDTVYYSNGDGTFRDASSEAGLIAGGLGLGVLLADVDVDGDLDIYVANDTTDNFLYLNDGQGRLEETALLNGAAVNERGTPDGSMGVDLCDFNQDSLPDLWVANYEREAFALYRNHGEGQFLHVSQTTGITALGGLYVGFGTAFFDVDLDGDEDVAVSNGHVINYPRSAPVRQLPLLLLNQAGHFARTGFSQDSYFGTPHRGRGLATGDLDGDGDLDLVLSNSNEPAAVLENDTPREGHWLFARLIGRASSREAVGARLILHTSAGDQIRQVKGGGSYLSQSQQRVHWGVAQGVDVSGLTVHWPSGVTQKLAPVKLDQQLTLIEPNKQDADGELRGR